MTTNKVDVAPGSPPAAAAPARAQDSPVRLFVLLGILALSIGALAYDYFVARPGVDAADKKIQEFVDARNKLGVKEGALVTPDDIHKELGMQPTDVEKHDADSYTIEYYRWWGHMPLINKRRHFISVVYVGSEPRRFSSHHRENPPPEALPIVEEPTEEEKGPLPTPRTDQGNLPAAAETPAAEAPAAESKEKPAAEDSTKSADKTDK